MNPHKLGGFGMIEDSELSNLGNTNAVHPIITTEGSSKTDLTEGG
jgi:hypothetical protein